MTRTRTSLLWAAGAATLLLAGRSAAQTQIFNNDAVVRDSMCVGADCADAPAFGFSTLLLQENNVRITFDDTSTAGPFASNDWQITINDAASGGASYFAVEDLTAATVPFRISAGAPTDSLATLADGTVAVGNQLTTGGRLGVGTSTPGLDVHVNDGDSPGLRLEQDNSLGWAPQVWDVVGNEANFFIRDKTHGSKLPFRMGPGAPQNSLTVTAAGVGIGTFNPDAQLHVIGDAHVSADVLVDGGLEVGTDVSATGNVSAGGNATIAGDVSVGGTLQLKALAVSSSRTLKTDIQPIDRDAALAVLAEIQPVTYRLKADPDEPTAGFIAEDVPDEVATNGRRSINPVEVVAFLTRAVQAQQEVIERQEREQREQQVAFEARLAALEQRLAESGAR
jgi:Chaperone of endosialidase